jgi:hypothetical protein
MTFVASEDYICQVHNTVWIRIVHHADILLHILTQGINNQLMHSTSQTALSTKQ